MPLLSTFAATSVSGFNGRSIVAGPPVWVTASGSLGSNYTERSSSFTTSATGATSYSLVSGSLPSGQSLNSSTGVISGTPTGIADYNSGTVFNFTLRASNSFGTSDRSFSITIASRYVGFICSTASEGGTISVTAPGSFIFNRRDFSSYGTPGGSCGAFTLGGCNSIASNSWNGPIGLNSATVPATNAQWGDPCGGTAKRMYVQFSYGEF